MMVASTQGTLTLRDGDGNPVNIEIILLPSGNQQPQSTPADANGIPYCEANPMRTSDISALPRQIDDGRPRVRAAELEELIGMLLAEQRLTNLLLAQAFRIKDDLDRLRADLDA